MMRLVDLSEVALMQTARTLASLLRAGDILCLSGPLGAGKTTFARGLLQGLGWSPAQDVPSPTYNLVISYAPPELRLPVAHIDLYRLDHAHEVAGLGLEDMMEDHLLLVEWPERWGAATPDERLMITLSGDGAVRTVRFDGQGDWMTRIDSLRMTV